MTPPGTFDRVLAAIRQRLREGWYRPGDRLEPALLSDELNASVTPVRDALHRLTGERLVEAPRQEGFRAPMMTESMLRHLYAWHLDILLLALARRRAERASNACDERSEESAGERLELAFQAIATLSGNPEHAHALRSVSERLDAFRRFEVAYLDGTDQESEQIIVAARAQDFRALRKALVRYHRRRQRIVAQLIARLQERS